MELKSVHQGKDGRFCMLLTLIQVPMTSYPVSFLG
jgi:hypothetical protein